MHIPAVSLTRRTLIGSLALAVVAASGPQAGLTQSSIHAIHDRLQEDLDRIRLPITPSHLTLVRLSVAQSGRHMDALVRLTWPPGTRQHRFQTTQGRAEETWDTLLSQIETRFRKPMLR